MGANDRNGKPKHVQYHTIALLEFDLLRACLQDVLTSAVESGITSFLFPAEHQRLAQDWDGVADFDVLISEGSAIYCDGKQVPSCQQARASEHAPTRRCFA